MTERKASDVLEEILEKLSKIESFCQNMDFNYKVIISRFDQLKELQIPHLTSAKSMITLDKGKSEAEVNLAIPLKSVIHEQKNSSKDLLEFPEAKVPSNSKTIVTQTVLYPAEVGKNNKVALAQVKLLNNDNQEISKTITDSAGRWKLELSPGNYFIHITKPSSNKKPKIDHYFPIIIDGNLKILELEPINVKNEN